MTASQTSLALGTLSLLLIVGALMFQYVGGIVPCEMCHWQRWPHIAAAVVGLGGGALIVGGVLDAKWAFPIALLTVLLIAFAGGLGVYHAGVEWKIWSGPAACTGPARVFEGIDSLNTGPEARCDAPAWRMFGISLAGYNAVISLAAATIGAALLVRARPKP